MEAENGERVGISIAAETYMSDREKPGVTLDKIDDAEPKGSPARASQPVPQTAHATSRQASLHDISLELGLFPLSLKAYVTPPLQLAKVGPLGHRRVRTRFAALSGREVRGYEQGAALEAV